MDNYLFDTCLVSQLLDPTRDKHETVKRYVASLDQKAFKYISLISIAELEFGFQLAVQQKHTHLPQIQKILKKAKQMPLLEVTQHTSSHYALVKARVAAKYCPNAIKNLPRWTDGWVFELTGEKLQIDENDLWICAQAMERNLVLVTIDNGIGRIREAVPNLLRLKIIN